MGDLLSCSLCSYEFETLRICLFLKEILKDDAGFEQTATMTMGSALWGAVNQRRLVDLRDLPFALLLDLELVLGFGKNSCPAL